MLKILKSHNHGSTVLSLSGRIEETDLVDLQTVLDGEIRTPDLTLDMEEVRLVHRGALRFFAACEAKGITLKNCPAYLREWLGAGRKPPSAMGAGKMRGKP